MTGPELCIRALRASDVDEVAALEAIVYAPPWTRGDFAAELALATSRSVVVRAGGALRGYAIAWLVAGELDIHKVTTAPEARRRGVGRALVAHLLAEPEVERASLEVRRGNAAARGLYRGAGFVEDGARPRYYADGEDAVLMSWGR